MSRRKEIPFPSGSLFICRMNANFLEKIIEYRAANGLSFSRLMIVQKIFFQFSVVQRKRLGVLYVIEARRAKTIPELLLVEARAAKAYWKLFEHIIGRKAAWSGRKAHGDDPANRLLDIGYHFLASTLTKICEEVAFPTELGFFHKAQSARSHPFVYDYMEWLRPIVVDVVLIRLLGKKKKPVNEMSQKLISRFVWLVKCRYATSFYHKKLKYCISLNYWMKLNLLQLSRAIREKKEYAPQFPSLRHENRCKKICPALKHEAELN